MGITKENASKIKQLIEDQQHKAAQEVAELVPTTMIPEVHREIRVYLGRMESARGYRLSDDQGMAMHDAGLHLITELEKLVDK